MRTRPYYSEPFINKKYATYNPIQMMEKQSPIEIGNGYGYFCNIHDIVDEPKCTRIDIDINMDLEEELTSKPKLKIANICCSISLFTVLYILFLL